MLGIVLGGSFSENITNPTRSLLVALKRVWPKWKEALIIVKPETVVYWQQKRFKKYWTEKSANQLKSGQSVIAFDLGTETCNILRSDDPALKKLED